VSGGGGKGGEPAFSTSISRRKERERLPQARRGFLGQGEVIISSAFRKAGKGKGL